MFKGLGDIAGLLKQATQLSSRMPQVTEELRQRRTEGTAGGGMVKVEVSGLMEVLRVRIDPQLVQQGDVELLEDLVLTAIRQAVQKSKQMHAEMLKELTGGVSLPMLDDAIAGMMGGGPADEGDQPGTSEKPA